MLFLLFQVKLIFRLQRAPYLYIYAFFYFEPPPPLQIPSYGPGRL